jgi:hypothetical protein
METRIPPFNAALISTIPSVLPNLTVEIASLVNRLRLPARSEGTSGNVAIRGKALGKVGRVDFVQAVEATAENRYQHGEQGKS